MQNKISFRLIIAIALDNKRLNHYQEIQEQYQDFQIYLKNIVII